MRVRVMCKGQTWNVQLLVCCAVRCCAGSADAYALTFRKWTESRKAGKSG